MTPTRARPNAFATLLVALVGAASLLTGCGGGCDDAAAPAPSGSASMPSVPITVSLAGTAATGAPIVGGTVTVVCAGSTAAVTTTTGSDGHFSVQVNQTPCFAKVTFGSPEQTLYSMTDVAGVLDISPFTDLVVAAYGHASPDVVFNAFNPANPTAIDATALANAIALVKRRVASAGVAVDALDLLHQGFSAQSGDPYDNALEALKATSVALSLMRTDVAAGRDAPLPVLPPLPNTPVITLAEPGDGQVRISWATQDATSYVVHFDVDNSGPGGVAFRQTANGASPLVIAALTNGTDYIVEVEAINAAGSVTGPFVHVTPKAAGLVFVRCPAGTTGCIDPHYGDGTNFGATYTAMAYTRVNNADHYVAVKSSKQVMYMIDDQAPVHLDFPTSDTDLVAVNAVAASEDGVVLAVGDLGLLMLSGDGGQHWVSTRTVFGGVVAAYTIYTSVAYGNGKFVAVGKYFDVTSGKPQDLLVTFPAHYSCPAGATCQSFSGLSAVTPGTSSGLSQIAFGNGRFVATGTGGYVDAQGNSTYGINAGYTSLDGTTFTFNTPTQAQNFNFGADKLFWYGGLFWGLIGQGSDTGGYRSVDGTAWNGNDWQVTNPGNFISDVTIGLNQIVAIDQGGYAYVNKTGGASKSAWVSSSPSVAMQSTRFQYEKNLVVYGDGRYVGISGGAVWVSK